MEPIFQDDISAFIQYTESLGQTLPLVMTAVEFSIKKSKDDIEKFYNDLSINKLQPDSEKINVEDIRKLKYLLEKYKSADSSYTLLPKSFIVTLVSQYDAFIGRIIHTILSKKPELLNGSERNLNYSQLIKFNSLSEATEYIIEKEVESVLRKSHIEQFEWLEKKLGVKLREGLDSWHDFVEITERRNLFVHCDGIISSQYITVCKQEGVILDNYKVGDNLDVNPDYFRKAYTCIFEIGIKLAHVIWRKLFPAERNLADENLNQICYDLLCKKRYTLVIKLLEFATTTLKQWCSEEYKFMFIINKAQAYKWSKNENICKQILSDIDFSACSNKFKLAKSVLLDDYKQAADIMHQIGKNDEDINEFSYCEWPLFTNFRKSEEFLNAYENIFGEQFNIVEENATKQLMSNYLSEVAEAAFSEEKVSSSSSPNKIIAT